MEASLTSLQGDIRSNCRPPECRGERFSEGWTERELNRNLSKNNLKVNFIQMNFVHHVFIFCGTQKEFFLLF